MSYCQSGSLTHRYHLVPAFCLLPKKRETESLERIEKLVSAAICDGILQRMNQAEVSNERDEPHLMADQKITKTITGEFPLRGEDISFESLIVNLPGNNLV